MPELLAIAKTAANSADFTLADGASAGVLLKNSLGAAPEGMAMLQAKTAGGVYIDLVALTRDKPLALLSAPGTYRVRRPVNENDVGVDVNTSGGVAVAPSSVVELASGSRTTTQTGADRTNAGHRGVHITIDTTAIGTGSITAKIQGKDANGIYYDLLSSAAIITNVTTVLKLYPGLPVTANVSASDVLPPTYRVVVTANNANAATYSVAIALLP